METKAVLFAWQGVLVDRVAGGPSPILPVAVAASRAMSRPVDEVEVAGHFMAALASYPGEPRICEVLVATFKALGVRSEFDAEAVARDMASCVLGSHQVFDDARALLGALRYRGFAIGAVAEDLFPGEWHREGMGTLGLPGYLDAFVTTADARSPVVDPRLFRLALDRLGTPPEQTLYVGRSSQRDACGAAAAGLQAIFLDRGGQPGEPGGGTISRLTALAGLLGDRRSG